MKKFLLLQIVFVVFILNDAYGQAGQWVWIHGDSTTNSAGNFGVQGVPSPTNDPPALYEPCEWTDLNGNFWMFGGESNGIYSALWKYDPSINEWTWMTDTNASNDPGVYGTRGVPSSSNHPPSKGFGVASWVDLNGNLWMFGGAGFFGATNDLWKYDIAINEWTWMKGSDIFNQLGIYGLQGIPDSSNNPGSRSECAAAWTDNFGDLWLFGGSPPSFSSLFSNDLWRFNIATNTWTWMKGSNVSVR